MSSRIVFIALVIVGTGCGGSSPSPADASPTGSGKPTFSTVQTQVLAQCISCHGAQPFENDLVLTADQAYSQLVGVASTAWPQELRVKPGNPDASLLYKKLTGMLSPDEGFAMPPIYPWRQLPTDQLQLMHEWITGGAANN